MALLRYRISSTPALPTQTEVLTQGLTSLQIDANFKSLDSAKVERVGEETITGSLTVDNIKTDGNVISSVNTNGNIEITPNGDGDIYLNADTVRFGDTNTDFTFGTNGTADLILRTNLAPVASGTIRIYDGAAGNIDIEPDAAGDVNLITDRVRLGSNDENVNITTQGAGDITIDTNAGTNSGFIKIFDGANQNIEIEPNGTGNLIIYSDTVELGGNSGASTTAEDVTVTTRNASDLTLNTNNGTNSGYVKIFDGANGNIDVEPNGTGDVNLITDRVRLGSNNEDVNITTQGAGDIIIDTNAGTNSGYIKIFDGANNNIDVEPNGTGDVNLITDNVRLGSSNEDSTITTNGTADLTLNTNAGTNSGYIKIFDGANNNIVIEPHGTGDVQINADTVRVGDADTAVTVTSNGTGNLVLRTGSTNSGAITINQGDNANIVVAPHGTGDIYLDSDTVRVGDADAAATVTSNGTGNLVLRTGSTNSGTVTINQGDNANIDIEPHNTGNVNIVADTVRIGSANEDVVVTTQGTGDITISTNEGTSSGTIKIFDGANNNIEIQQHGTGTLVINEAGNAADTRIEGDADVNLFFVDASADRVAVGTNSPENKFHIQQISAATNTVTDVLRLDSQSSGVPAVGIGVGMEFAVETTASNVEVGAIIEAVTTDITATSEDFDLVFRTMIAGAAAAQVGKLNNNTFQVGANATSTTITTQGAANLTLSTNAGTDSGTILINNGANGNIELTPNGTGDVYLNADAIRVGDSNAEVTVTSNGTGNLVLRTGSTNSGTVTINQGDNANIVVAPHGTGDVYLDADTIRVGDADTAVTVTSNGTGNLVLRTGSTNSGNITITQGDDANISVTPHGTGDVQLNADTVRVGDADAAATITSNGTGNLVLRTGSTNSGTVTINQGDNANIVVAPHGTGDVQLDADTIRVGDANAEVTLVSNGTGNLVLKTGSTNSGSITINQGDNANIVVAPHGTGDIYLDADTVRVGDSNAEATVTSNGTGNLVLRTGSTNSGNITINQGDDANIVITPHGTGDVQVDADTLRVGDANAAATVTTNGTGNLVLRTGSTNSGNITITQGDNANIVVTPHGTGDVQLDADTVRIGDAGAAATLTTNGAANLTLSTNEGTNSGTILINNGLNGNIELTPNGTGDVYLNADTVRIGDSNADATITTNGTGDLILNTNAGTNSSSITIFDAANGNISIQTNGTGEVVINDAGNSADFRVEGDTDANLFIADASADRVGIGTATPTAKLNVEGSVIINDGGADVDVRIEGDSDANLFFTDASVDRVGVGLSAPSRKLHVQQTSAATAAVTQLLRLESLSSGTPANGIGVGLEFAVETTADNSEIGATIEVVASDITAASEDFDLYFRTMIAGAAAAQVGKLNNNTLQIGATGVNTSLTTLGTANLTMSTNSGTDSGTIVITNGANQNITLTPNGTGRVNASGNVTLGVSTSNTLVVNALVNSNLLFTDATYDIGASGATRPRSLFLSNNITTGGSATIGTDLAVNGNTTLGDANTDTVTATASMANGTAWRTTTTSGNNFHLGAYDNNDTAYRNLLTLTAGNIPNISIGGVAGATSNITSTIFKRSGDVSSTAWTTVSPITEFSAATFTDTSTALNGTVTGVRSAISMNSPTFASTNTNVTVVTGATLYVENPVAGTNTTVSNRYAIYNAGNEYIGGSLTVNGDAVFLSQSLSLNGKTVVVGNVTAKTGVTATATTAAGGTGPFTAILTGVSEALSPGQVLTKTSGAGTFGTNTRVVSVSGSVGAFTVNVEADTAFTNGGSVTFDVSGPTDYSANQGGLVLKGLTDKSILWVDSTDSWTFNQNIETSGRIKTGNFIQDGTLTGTLSTTSQTSVDTSPHASVKSIKYIIQATRGSAFQYSEIMVVNDGTNAYMVEYANVFTSVDPLVSYDADISGANVRLLATAAAATTTLKILKIHVV